ncbi:MAG: flavodoxin family protein [Deltaproteobacteria bacterium]|nr:flavodoxin family protein [Deltaproteobacteria bacterium]
MIKLIGICGSRVKDGNMEALLNEAMAHARQQSDVGAEVIPLWDMKIHGCTQCNWCMKHQSADRPCVQDDDMVRVYPRLLEADGIILASPAHFGRLSGCMADLMDRTRALIHGSVYQFPLRNKVGGAMAISYFRGGGLETTLSSMDLFFLCQRMIIATSGLYQLGAGAYSSVAGTGQFAREPRHMVLEDDYGTLSARMLLDRVIELTRIVKAGQSVLQNGPETAQK